MQQNSRKFSPKKVSRYTVYYIHMCNTESIVIMSEHIRLTAFSGSGGTTTCMCVCVCVCVCVRERERERERQRQRERL